MSIRPDRSGATHQTSIEGSAEVILRSRRLSEKAGKPGALASLRCFSLRHSSSGVDCSGAPPARRMGIRRDPADTHRWTLRAVAVIQTLLETLPCLSRRWIQKKRAHGINRVQLVVTRGEGVAVQNAQVSVFKGWGGIKHRSAASRQSSPRGFRSVAHGSP